MPGFTHFGTFVKKAMSPKCVTVKVYTEVVARMSYDVAVVICVLTGLGDEDLGRCVEKPGDHYLHKMSLESLASLIHATYQQLDENVVVGTRGPVVPDLGTCDYARARSEARTRSIKHATLPPHRLTMQSSVRLWTNRCLVARTLSPHLGFGKSANVRESW
jgi:hypothetical protein